MPKLLTKRKAKWVAQRQPDVIRGTPLNPNAADELRYYRNLERLVRMMTDQTERQIKRLFETPHAEEYFAEDASISSQARILTNALAKKFNALFAANAKPIAEKVADAAATSSSSALHSSIQQLSGGLSLPTSSLSGQVMDILKATVAENVSLIKSISSQYLAGVEGAVNRSIASGNGLQDLVPFLQNHKDITLRRAQMIAKDQTRKAFSNLSRGRMENIGLKKFEWLHTGGSNHPRKLHQEMNGKIYSFDDLPVIDENTGERGIPAQAINCRCRMVPIIDFGDE